jgi:hypothetical protein
LCLIHPSSGSTIRLPGTSSRTTKRRKRTAAPKFELQPEEPLETANRRFIFLLRAKSTICPWAPLLSLEYDVTIPFGNILDGMILTGHSHVKHGITL